jgi:hypothetical protein
MPIYYRTELRRKKRGFSLAGVDEPVKGPFAHLLLGPPFFHRARAEVEQRLLPLQTKTKCIAVFFLLHLLLLSLLFLQGSGNPLVFARKRDIAMRPRM